MEKHRDEIVANIRGCLISVKGRVELRQLSRDYRQLMGGDIPYRDFGCSSLETFLQGIPSLIVTRNSEGLVTVDARASDKSSHITDMVSKQKAPKKKTSNKFNSRSSRYNNYSGMNQPAPHTVWRPKNVSTRWKTTYKNTPRPSAVSHNQFVNVRLPATPEKAKPAPQKITRTVSLNNNNNVQQKEVEVRVEGFTKQRSFIASPEQQVSSPVTNRANIMSKTISSPQLLASPTLELLKENALAAVDPNSRIWNFTSSSDGSDTNDRMFHQSGEHFVDLFSYARFKNLPEPVFKVMQRQSKPHKPIFFDCKVQVGPHSYSTYPKDFKDELSAKYCASKLALEALISKYGTRKRQSLLNSKEVDVLERIPPLVQKHFHGIWSWQLQDDYQDMFQEQLPLNWLQIVDTIPTISMQLMIGNKYVLRFCNPEDLLQKGKGSSMQLMYDVSIPTSSVNFNPGQTLLAEVTSATSAKEIWCRQLRTTEAEDFEKMLVEMEELYNRERDTGISKFVENPSKGSYYAAFIDDSWQRIQIYEANEGEQTLQCFLVDKGDVQIVNRTNVYSLRRHFAKECAQAFLCRLFGLEELYEVSNMSEAISNLEGATVQLEQCVDEDFNSRDDPVNVVMYDVETGNSINEELVELITIENALPILDMKSPNEVYVSNIETNGDIYIQVHSMGYEKLTSLLEDLEATLLENPAHVQPVSVTPENSEGCLYFSKASDEEHFQRVRIIDWSPARDMAQLYFVDTGHCPVVLLNKTLFYPLDEISNVVNRFPDQALRVQLDIERVPDNFAEIVQAMVPKDDSVIVRVVEVDDKDAHIIKMFVRVPNVGLVSVDESINVEVKKQENNIKSERKLYKSKNVPSAGNLKPPPLATIGDFFDVKIPCATNPWNFFVQPFETYDKLTKLMQQLQTRYADVQYSPLSFDDIMPGRIYASKYEDGRWYRTCVMKVIHSGSISVFYCDFGYYWSLTVQQLLPLDIEFLQLPYQAIKAKLVGIKPKQQTWSMEDCKYFQKIVVSKTLVSILRTIEKDELYKYDTVLGLNLIDTSTEEDVYIDKILIRKGIAIEALPVDAK